MKETLLQLAKYNLWANKLIIDTMQALPEDKLDMPITSSFPTIRQTVLHTWAAEDIWLQRLQLVENPVWKMTSFQGSFAEACEEWIKASTTLISFIEDQRTDAAFTHVVAYYNLKREHFKNQTDHVLTHVFNHGTYHRGQLVTMLRQAGVTKIPGTDYIAWVRNPKG